MKEFVDWIRIIVVGGIFALMSVSDVTWIKWGFLGMTLMILAIKVEDSTSNNKDK